MDLTLASKSRLMQLNELAELRDGAYENTRIYKERTKKWHDYRLRGDKDVKNGFSFKVNGQRLKKYYKGNIDNEDDEVIEFENDVTLSSQTVDTTYPIPWTRRIDYLDVIQSLLFYIFKSLLPIQSIRCIH
ncbi:hypothetical protein Tco_0014766 [Tanacetum coccineum]